MPRPHGHARRLALASTASALLASWPLAGQAGSFDLQVAPLPGRPPGGPCPQMLALIEDPQPYREGSYEIRGRAPRGAIATGWRLARRDGLSATWVAQLLPAYQRCSATAGIVRADKAPYRDHSYLRLRFGGGQVQLILDMTGMRDPNGYTPLILSAGVSQGLPVWSWGGSD